MIKNHEVLYSYTGLLVQGKVSFDSIEEFRDVESYITTMKINNYPSSPTLRQRLKNFDLDFNSYYENNIPLNMDYNPFNNSDIKKEGVNRTYKGFDGYGFKYKINWIYFILSLIISHLY